MLGDIWTSSGGFYFGWSVTNKDIKEHISKICFRPFLSLGQGSKICVSLSSLLHFLASDLDSSVSYRSAIPSVRKNFLSWCKALAITKMGICYRNSKLTFQ